MRKFVCVELDQTRNWVVRIFRSESAAYGAQGPTDVILYSKAVSSIRHALFIRSKGLCELCSEILTEKSGHMHEQMHRGKGGEISLENSVFICARTHKREHRDRNVRWGETVCQHMNNPFECKLCRERSIL
jgi:5-methylcytosine-specific restriction endonuclease McrA